jgi:hypothetical protein
VKRGLSPTLHKRFRRTEKFISRVARLNRPYKLGGGRRWDPPRTVLSEEGGDCSWWAMELAAKLGIKLKNPAGSTLSLAEEGSEGIGDLFTLFIKNPPGEVDNEHVIVRMRRRPLRSKVLTAVRDALVGSHRWTECGGNDNPKPLGGPTWFRPTVSRVAEFPIRRHFPELEAL